MASYDAEGHAALAEFDDNSNRVSVRDPNGIGQDVAYDDRNRAFYAVDTQGDKRVTLYDTHNNLRKTIDWKGSRNLTPSTVDIHMGGGCGAHHARV